MTAQQTAVLAALAQVMGLMPASAKVSRKTKATAKAVRGKFDAQAAIDRAVKAKGLTKPGIANENVLTYGKWEAKGFRVKTGQKALKVGTLRLFHEEQVEPISTPAVEA